MSLSSILSLLFGSGLLLTLTKYIISRIKENERKTEAVCLGVQALLRDRLYNRYEAGVKKGYATLSEKENFDNMYQQYHSLGKNGVMDGLREDYMELPHHK